jgi:hypothetical protein
MKSLKTGTVPLQGPVVRPRNSKWVTAPFFLLHLEGQKSSPQRRSSKKGVDLSLLPALPLQIHHMAAIGASSPIFQGNHVRSKVQILSCINIMRPLASTLSNYRSWVQFLSVDTHCYTSRPREPYSRIVHVGTCLEAVRSQEGHQRWDGIRISDNGSSFRLKAHTLERPGRIRLQVFVASAQKRNLRTLGSISD